jgi:predicted Zn-dependent protease with MMP-like domain
MRCRQTAVRRQRTRYLHWVPGEHFVVGDACYNEPAMDRDDFEQLVADTIETLPDEIRARLDNVEVVVEEWPDPATLHRARLRSPASLLGFYHGIPQTERTTNYGMVLPDRISIYRQPILRQCRGWQEVRELAASVVRHEIAHHFGISDERLLELGAY